LEDYFRRGARWTSGPKPQLTDELFDPSFKLPEKGEPIRCLPTEFEPVPDAADFFRCGRDIFVTRSNVTNAMGIDRLRRHLGEGYLIYEIKSRCPNPMRIHTTILPLGPGKIPSTRNMLIRTSCL
jgi:glycine amidinotransferase